MSARTTAPWSDPGWPRLAGTPFETRRALAEAMLEAPFDRSPATVAERDQFHAAHREVRLGMGQVATLLPLVAPLVTPGRRWYAQETTLEGERSARLLAALLGCATVCQHLREGGPQPVIARLALRRLDCRRCATTWRNPPADEADRCDVCGTRGVTTFSEFEAATGLVVMLGNACMACAPVLGPDAMADSPS